MIKYLESYLDIEKLMTKKKKEVCIFGAGKFGRNGAYELLELMDVKVDFYCDNYVPVDTIVRDNIRVRDVNYLYENQHDIWVFLCILNGGSKQEQILNQLKEKNVENVLVINRETYCAVLTSIDSADENIKGKYSKLYDDEKYLKYLFEKRMGYIPDLKKPRTFNEKLQWLKIHDRRSEYTNMVDKYEFKKYIAGIIGEQYVIPTIGVWDSVDAIEWDKLPEQFVLKCTHDSGSVAICRNKEEFDSREIKEKFSLALSHNYYWSCREWPYKNVKPRIIAEEYMEEEGFKVLNVYKIFNFNGKPRLIQVIQDDKTLEETIDYFDTQWNRLELRQNYPNSKKSLPCPEQLDEILELAEKLSQGIPFVRTDFYIINGKIYVSEFTFYSDAGMAKFHPTEWDYVLGDYILLPCKKEIIQEG